MAIYQRGGKWQVRLENKLLPRKHFSTFASKSEAENYQAYMLSFLERGVVPLDLIDSPDNLLIHKALDMLEAGDVLVVDGEGDTTRALVGEIMMTSARVHGAVAFVMDGAIRDADAFETYQFPCWARGISLRGPYKDGPGSINVSVTIGGMVVNPGDVIVGDGDGIIAVPSALAVQVAELAHAKVAHEKETIASILDGTYSSAWVDATLKQKDI